MADGITVQWKLNTANGGTSVSLCDGPERAVNKFVGPLESGGDQFSFAVQELPALGAVAKKFVSRGNMSVSLSLRVRRECSDMQSVFYYMKIWPSQLATQSNLAVTSTRNGSTVTYFLNNAVLESVTPEPGGISPAFTFRFLGGVWTTT